MKKLFTLSAIIVVLFFMGCEKDEVVEPMNNTNNTDTTSTINPTDTTNIDPVDTVSIYLPDTSDYSETVDTVDVARYVGLWYEIQSLPQFFSTGCHCTTAKYTVIGPGEIEVENNCNLGSVSGTDNNIVGSATVVPGSGNAKLKVTFFPPFSADYWILELHPDYEWAVVGDPNKSTFWILSRTPRLDQIIVDAIIAKWSDRGYDLTKLEITPQDGC